MKKIAVILLAVVMVFSFSALVGCDSKGSTSATEAEWSISIKDSSGKTIEFTNMNAGKMEMVEVDAVHIKKDGTEVNEKWKGVALASVLEYCGITDYSMIAIEASDGYRLEYDKAAVVDSGTILGFFLDGTEVSVEDGLVQLVANSLEGKFWIKNIAVIEVIE